MGIGVLTDSGGFSCQQTHQLRKELMNETAAVANALLNPVGDEKNAESRRPMLFAWVILFLGLVTSIWLILSVSPRPARGGSVLGQNQEIVYLAAGAGVLVTFLLAGGLFGSTAGRRKLNRELSQQQEDWRKQTMGLQVQLAESRKSESMLGNSFLELEQRVKTYEQSNHQLKTELDQLKRAEKTLSQQRQVLESSKTVLELHVQARTKELQKLQRRYEMILNAAGEGICGLDFEGKATFVNPAVAKFTGWSVQELIGKTQNEIFGLQQETNGLALQENNAGECIFMRKDGSAFAVEFVRTEIQENGRVTGTVVVFKDITERKRAEETMAQKAAELARSNAELEQFAFVASHDLQEPLRKIQAFGDRLKVKCDGLIGDDAKDYLERMQSAAARMRTLINDLLAFSRVIRSSEPFVAVDMNVVTKEILGDLEVRIEKSAAQIELSQLHTIDADPMQMRQLMLNLLSNALKFQTAGAKPLVKVNSRCFTTVSGEQMCEITVADNGIGFEEKYLEKIFAVFQRLHGRTEYEGTGVGLAVCRRITDRHHGTITAKSQLGQGATFIVTLPMRQSNEKTTK
jgi:two-component system sensor kinase FixL